MQKRKLVPVLTGAFALAAAAPALAPSPAQAAAHRPAALVAYTGGDVRGLSAATDRGAVAADQVLEVDLVLTRPGAAAEAAYESALADPASPSYRQFLTAEQFGARFGVSQATYDEALAFATAHGLTLRTTTPTHDTLVLRGTAAQVEATFATHLEQFSYAGKDFFANTSSPLVPADLPITALFGLETVHRAHTANATGADQSSCTTTPATPVVPASTLCKGNLTPQDLWSAYDQPDSVTGQGQKMTIFGQGTYQSVIADLRTFEAKYGLPQIPVSVILADGADDGTNYTDASGNGEWTIDTQASTGMAPNAKELDLVWGTTYHYTSLYNVLTAWVNTPGTSNAASASYSDCEPFPGSDTANGVVSLDNGFDVSTSAYVRASEQQLIQAVVEGKTLFSSSGDTGGSCDPGPVPNAGVTGGTVDVGYPASSPHAVGVGGTVLYTDTPTPTTTTSATRSAAKRVQEYPWTGTGGGNSNIYSEPAYQKAALGTVTGGTQDPDTPCLYDDTLAPDTSGRTCRKVPDVAAVSGDVLSNGYVNITDGATSSAGGTSLSSPLILGLWTRLQSASCQVSASGVSGLGYANDTFYPAWTANKADFFDPSNDPSTSKPVTNTPWTSGPGYDDLTGLGVPDVANLLTHVVHSSVPCATAPTDQPLFPTTTPTTRGTPAATLPDATVPVVLVLVALAGGGALVVRRRRAV